MLEKSCIREAKNFSTNMDSSTDTKKILLSKAISQTTSFHYFSTRIPNFKNKIEHPTSGSGPKRGLIGTSKVKRRTHRRTFRLIERIGPEGRFFKKVEKNGQGFFCCTQLDLRVVLNNLVLILKFHACSWTIQ